MHRGVFHWFIDDISAPVATSTEFADARQQALVDTITTLRDTFTAQLALDPNNANLLAAIAALESALIAACEFLMKSPKNN